MCLLFGSSPSQQEAVWWPPSRQPSQSLPQRRSSGSVPATTGARARTTTPIRGLDITALIGITGGSSRSVVAQTAALELLGAAVFKLLNRSVSGGLSSLPFSSRLRRASPTARFSGESG